MNKPITTADRQPNDLSAYFMPFTAQRQFKQAPRMLVSAEGMTYRTHDGRTVLDAAAGMWCVNAGHGREKIREAVKAQVDTMDYAPPFQMAHPLAFELARKVADLAPDGMERVFFTNSGSEAVDTALKIALAYHRVRGEGQRTRLIGRERGYHGVGFGGISVGGISNNRKLFGGMLGGVDHLPHTYDRDRMAFSRGQPEWGGHLADALEGIVALHDASTVAAVIVEPMAGSTGVLVPPVGYLERLRAICTKHGILLILDEVITGFGRLGAAFAANRFAIQPDIITCAKGLTNGTVPMGAAICSNEIYETFMSGPEHAVEFPHGYTYTAHPLACAAGVASLEIYEEEGLFERALELAPYFEDAVHSLKDCPNVVDIRNIGLVGAVELAPRPGAPGKRGFEAFLDLYQSGVLCRMTGDILALSPPLVVTKGEIDQIVDTVGQVLKRLA